MHCLTKEQKSSCLQLLQLTRSHQQEARMKLGHWMEIVGDDLDLLSKYAKSIGCAKVRREWQFEMAFAMIPFQMTKTRNIKILELLQNPPCDLINIEVNECIGKAGFESLEAMRLDSRTNCELAEFIY